MSPDDTLNWRDDGDCIRVAEMIVSWMGDDCDPMTIDEQRDFLKTTSLWDLLDDILVTVEDGRFADDAQDIRNRIGH